MNQLRQDQNRNEEFTQFANRLADISQEMIMATYEDMPNVHVKADKSFVTDTDRAVEKRLRKIINVTYPDHGIYGEEYGTENLEAEFVWVLDPIDGTLEFIAGIPVFGTLIGLAHNGRPHLGVLNIPVTRDRWVGISGVSATRNGKPVSTRACDNLEDAVVTCYGIDTMDESAKQRFYRLKEITGRTIYGGGCYTYGVLASGRIDVTADPGLDPYDVYATIAIIEGAGGVVTDWEGNPIDFNWSGLLLAAGDPKCHAAALKQLNKN